MPESHAAPTSASSAVPAARTIARSAMETWFPVAFARDVEPGRLHRVTLFDEGYVFFRGPGGGVHALVDRCPHRMARLSDGRLRDGRVECLYHGWQFHRDGACVHIPQLEPGQAIPRAACAHRVAAAERQGIVWLCPGRETAGECPALPAVPDVDAPGCRSVDFAIDLPYGQHFLIENVLDYAHVHVSHDGVRGGGHSGLAGPLAFELAPLGAQGFRGRIGRSAGGRIDAGTPADAHMEFAAPNLVHYWSVPRGPATGRVSGLLLYCVPLGRDRCRLLYRAYGSVWPLRDRLRPRFWEHGHQCHLLEQDMAVVMGQAAEIARSRVPLTESWLPLKSSDTPVLAFRQWLDSFAADSPDYVGLRTRGPDSHRVPPAAGTDRLQSHVRQCSSCARALRTAQRVRRGGAGAAFAALAAAAVGPPGWNVACAAVAAIFYAAHVAAGALVGRLCGRAVQPHESALSSPLSSQHP